MRALVTIFALACSFVTIMDSTMASPSFYDLSAESIDGEVVKLSEYKGKVLLVVNVASKCGFTPQYEGLQNLFTTYKDKGLVVLGFPSNDFGQQEPGSESAIKQFCTNTYGVTFPLFSKVKVVGPSKHPIYDFMTKSTGGAEVGWNFEKFLINQQGVVVERFNSNVKPSDPKFVTEIEKLLAAS